MPPEVAGRPLHCGRHVSQIRDGASRGGYATVIQSLADPLAAALLIKVDAASGTAISGQDLAFAIPIEVRREQHVTVDHNEVNDLPYSGITIGWGGWRERLGNLSPLANYSQHNAITNNLVFNYMQVMADGGGIYSNGIQGSYCATANG